MWRAYEMEHRLHCCIDDTQLTPIAMVTGHPGVVVLGHCDACGLLSYMTPPTREAVSNYYRRTWMGETADVALGKAGRGYAHAQPHLLYASKCDPAKPALEIGSGYGETLRCLQLAGFQSVEGVEACKVRADASRQVCNVDVANCDFADFTSSRKYGLIVADQVLEHSYDPLEFVRKCADLQDEGDHLVISVPDFWYEAPMAIIMFWPHLHTFTHYALDYLLSRCGYEVIGKINHPGDVNLFARKTCQPSVPSFQRLHFETAVAYLANGLRPVQGSLTWLRPYDQAVRKLHTSEITERKSDAPIEIQCTGRLEMYEK